MNRAKTRELPDHYPFVVTKNLINNVTEQWEQPSHDLFEDIFLILSKFVAKVVGEHFGEHTKGGLQQLIM